MWFILSWRDGIELFFFCTLFYVILRWLHRHKLAPLAHYAVAYCAIFTCAHYFQLTTVAHFLLAYGPIIAMLFIIFHEHILQKNFITLTHSARQTMRCDTWPEAIVRLSLHRGSNNSSTLCIVDRNAYATPFLISASAMDAPLTPELADLLATQQELGIIWIDATTGKVYTSKARWNTHGYVHTKNSGISGPNNHWYEYALSLTNTTDAIVFSIEPHHNSFTFFAQGKIQHNLPAHQLLSLLRKQTSHLYSSGDKIHGAHREHSF